MDDCPNDPSNGYGSHNTSHPLPCSAPGCDCAAALRKDAERYRWLRDVAAIRSEPLPFVCGPNDLALSGCECDSAIDAAMLACGVSAV